MPDSRLGRSLALANSRSLRQPCRPLHAVDHVFSQSSAILHQTVGALEPDHGFIPIELLAQHPAIVNVKSDRAVAELLDDLRRIDSSVIGVSGSLRSDNVATPVLTFSSV